MRRIVFSVFLLGLFHAGLFAEVEKIPLTWTVGQGVRVVGATPIGQLYQFDPSPSCTYLTYSRHRLRAGCRCISCQTLLQAVSGNLEVSLPKNRKKRFGALLFQLRVCPAFSKNETAEAVFFLMGSSLERISGKSYGNLSNMLEVTPRQVKYSALGSRTNRTAVEIPYPCDPQSVFLPDFETFPVLFAYDFQTGRIAMRHYGDDRIRFSRESDIPIDRKNLKTLAFSMGPSRKTFRSHIELSDPTFYAFDREEELDSIPIPKLTEYSYRDYPFPEQKKKKSKKSNLLKSIQKSGNPELQYACALRLLYTPDCQVETALELLESAAKKQHALALYQLGICLFRGYGVERNLKKALRCFQQSGEYGNRKAYALAAFLLWDSGGRNWSVSPSLARVYREFVRKGSTKPLEHDAWVVGSLGCDVGTAGPSTPLVSPKLLKDRLSKKDQETMAPVLSSLLEKENPFAYRYQGFCLGLGNPRTPVLFEKAFQGGDRGIFRFLLLALERNGKSNAVYLTEQNDLLFADEPVYQICRIRQNQKNQAARAASKKNDAEKLVLEGLTALANLPPISLAEERNRKGREGFLLIQKAAEQGNPAAQYFVGRAYYYRDFDFYNVADTTRRNQMQVYFTKAAQQGHRKAMEYLLELEFAEKKSLSPEHLTWLDQLCSLGSGKAYLLKGEIARQKNRNREFQEFVQKAISCGEYAGWRIFAQIATQNRKEETARHCWFQFISADLESRKKDFYDPYEENIYETLLFP